MQRTFCDSCGTAIADLETRTMRIWFNGHSFHLCTVCCGALVEMLKDLGVYKDAAA